MVWFHSCTGVGRISCCIWFSLILSSNYPEGFHCEQPTEEFQHFCCHTGTHFTTPTGENQQFLDKAFSMTYPIPPNISFSLSTGGWETHHWHFCLNHWWKLLSLFWLMLPEHWNRNKHHDQWQFEACHLVWSENTKFKSIFQCGNEFLLIMKTWLLWTIWAGEHFWQHSCQHFWKYICKVRTMSRSRIKWMEENVVVFL